MQLTRYTDYSLRVLMYLALHPEELATVNDIAAAFGISHNHLLKVVRRLGALGLIRTTRGRNGGLALARAPEEIGLGEVVRHMEGRLELVNCTDPSCPILAPCLLRGVLNEARDAFLAVLDRHTLASLLEQREPALRRLLQG